MTHASGRLPLTGRATPTRSERLDLLHRQAEALTRHYHAAASRHQVRDRGATDAVRAIVGAAREDMLMCLNDPLDEWDYDYLAGVLARGVDVRMVCTPAVLGAPGQIAVLRRPELRRIVWRVARSVPVAMLIVDQRSVILPATDRILDSAPYARVCAALFETQWRRATTPDSVTGEPPDSIRSVAGVLSCGLDDGAAADALGVSRRTVERRVADLMARTGARTRFQAGYRWGLGMTESATCSTR